MLLDEISYSKRIKSRNSIKDLNEDVDNELFNLYETQSLNEEFFNLRKKYILASYDSHFNEDYDLLQEANNKFLTGIIDILKKFIELVKSMYNNFIKSILKVKDLYKLYAGKIDLIDLSNIDTDKVYFEGYNYTLKTIPNVNINTLTLNGPFTFDENILKNLSSGVLLKIDDNSKNDRYYDEIRGKILGIFHAIPTDKFDEYIKKQLRNGKDKPEKIILSSYGSIESIRASLINYKDDIESITKEKENILRIYTSLIKYFNSILKMEVSYQKNPESVERRMLIKSFTLDNELNIQTKEDIQLDYNKDLYDKIKKYSIARSAEVKNLSQIISKVFAGKIEATKEKYKQDLDIIKKLIIAK